jgi:hypothetical protein
LPARFADVELIRNALRDAGVAHGDLVLGIHELVGQRDAKIEAEVTRNTLGEMSTNDLFCQFARALIEQGTYMYQYQPMTVAEAIGAIWPEVEKLEANLAAAREAYSHVFGQLQNAQAEILRLTGDLLAACNSPRQVHR